MNHIVKDAKPHKLSFKYTCKIAQLQRKDVTTGDLTCLDDIASDKIFATLPVLTLADPMFEPAVVDKMASAQLFNISCAYIRYSRNEEVAIPLGDYHDKMF